MRIIGDLRDSLIRDRIVGGVLSDELRSNIWLCKPHMIIAVHSRQPNFRSTPTHAGTEHLLGIHPVRKFKVQEKTTAHSCKFCGYKHPLPQPPRCPTLGKSATNARRKDTLHRCKESGDEGSQVKAAEQETPLRQGVHTYFASVELHG